MAIKFYDAKDVTVTFGGMKLEGLDSVSWSKPDHRPRYTTEEIREARKDWEARWPEVQAMRDAMAAKVRELTQPVQPFTVDLRGFHIRSARATVFRRPSIKAQGMPRDEFLSWADHTPGVALEWVCIVVVSITDPEDGDLELSMVEVHPYHPDDLTDPSRQRYLRRWAQATIRKAVEHELDECLRIDGELAANPHPEIPGYQNQRETILRRQDNRATVEFVVDDPISPEKLREFVRQHEEFTPTPEDDPVRVPYSHEKVEEIRKFAEEVLGRDIPRKVAAMSSEQVHAHMDNLVSQLVGKSDDE